MTDLLESSGIFLSASPILPDIVSRDLGEIGGESGGGYAPGSGQDLFPIGWSSGNYLGRANGIISPVLSTDKVAIGAYSTILSERLYVNGSIYASQGYLFSATTSITIDGSGNLVFTDPASGSRTLASLIAGGGGDVFVSGIPTNLQLAQWVTASSIQGIDISSLTLTESQITSLVTDLAGKASLIHDLIDATNHPVTGLTTGYFLKALSDTTYGFDVHGLTKADIGLTSVTDYAQVRKISSSTNLAIARWDGTSGALLKNSLSFLADDGTINIPFGTTYNINGVPHTHAGQYQVANATLAALAVLDAITGVIYQTGANTFTKYALAGSGIALSLAHSDHTHTQYQSMSAMLNALVALVDGAGVLVNDGSGVLSWGVGGGGVNVSGTPSVGQVALWTNATTIEGVDQDTLATDAFGALTNITTNNATTVQHGFLPKLDGGTSVFLRGDGTWATPAGAGDVSLFGSPVTGTLVLWHSGTTIETLAFGTSGQLLRTNIAGTAVEFFTPAYLIANQTITLSGDVSGSGTVAITTAIGVNKVTLAMMAQMATNSFLGRITAGVGNVEVLTATQATSLLNLFSTSSTVKGLTPGSNSVGITYFLCADGTWKVPSGSGTTPVDSTLLDWSTDRYLAYGSKGAGGELYTGTTDPTATTRLNYNGNLYSNYLYAAGQVYAGTGTTFTNLSNQAVSINISGSNYMSLNPNVAASGSAHAYQFRSYNSLITGDRIASFWNQTTEKLYIDYNGTIRTPTGITRHLIVQAGAASGSAGTDAGNISLIAGNALGSDTASVAGIVYLVPGNGYNTGVIGVVSIGNANYGCASIRLISAGSQTNVDLLIQAQAAGGIQLGSGSTIITNWGTTYLAGNTYLGASASASIIGSAGISGNVLGKNVTITGGAGYSTGNNAGGNLYLYGGTPNGSGTRGNIYFGSGSEGYLPAKSSETNVVYYDSTTGKLSYGAAGSGGVTLSGSTNNTVCTVTGANAIIGEANLTFDGSNLVASGTMTATNFILSSDRRLKTNIVSYKPELLDIDYKKFVLKSDITQQRYGVIADLLQKDYPELIREDKDGMLSVAYFDLLIREIVYLKDEVNKLKNGRT